LSRSGYRELRDRGSAVVADDDLFDPPVHDRPLLGGGRRDRDLQSLFGRCEPSRDAATILAKPRLDGVEVLVVNQ
jgi:hypothetical protein